VTLRATAFVGLVVLTACHGQARSESLRSAAPSSAAVTAPPSASLGPGVAGHPPATPPVRDDPSTRCDLSAHAAITGEVRDTAGRLLCGATVVTEWTGVWAQKYLPRDATFVGPWERAGTFRITASRPGYEPAVVEVHVPSDRCHVRTQSVKLKLRHIAGTQVAPPCEDFESRLSAGGVLFGPGPYDNLPESSTPFVTGVETEGLRAFVARRLAALQPAFQECWEHNHPPEETRPFFLDFTAQVFVNGQVSVETPTRDDPEQVPDGLRDCIARQLSMRQLLPPSGSARFSLFLAFRE